ncbi:hypothetical protein J2751_000208 [Halorubrum alkaliphilum]|uniref:LTD domain-containing protein n=1 Tax=Halorubrum alkaliphilum TaxID=261290 RepID=A0A8T4GDM5_9EURY|nr:lamin tail domain-containing protein [Halorubrum alkaliphilum]MBP1921225.1 hypothetical protein [Halorubrum alkaliphilum]
MSSVKNVLGRVVDGSGSPLSGRVVVGRIGGESDPIGHWITDGSGEFPLVADGGSTLDPSDLSFTVRDPTRGGGADPISDRTLDEDGETTTVELTVASTNTPIHGSVEHRGMNHAATTRMGRVRSHRFCNQFPELDVYDRTDEFFRTLGDASETEDGELDGPMMEAADDPVGDADTPAAYGIFGQFIDHDITFDPTSDVDRRNDPSALRNFRTPALDLDALYRTGPGVTPFLFDREDPHDARLVTGSATAPDTDEGGLSGLPGTDLQRNEQGVALIGDPRNDENVLIAQIHLAFANFNNRVVDYLTTEAGGELRRENESVADAAHRLVRWHYQWVVRHDFLERVCDAYVLEDIEENGRRFFLPPDKDVAIPVEFAGAGFRFGHSLIRHEFDINEQSGNVRMFPSESGEEPHLRGGSPVPSHLVVDWTRLLDTGDGDYQSARKIMPFLAPTLFQLPMDGEDSLAMRNFQRARALGLPSGQDVAKRMGIDPIRNEGFGDDAPIMEALRKHGRGADGHAPLWYYVLDEARYQNDGERLGAVGTRIVAETLIGLIEADEAAYPNAAPDGWEPSLPQLTDTEGYTLADLIAFGEEGAPDGLVIDAINPGPGGDGDPLNESVTLRNATRETVDLSGYVLDLSGGQRDDLPDTTLAPDATVTIHVGSGTDTDADYYLGRERAALNDEGDTVTLLDPDGEVSTRRVYR